MYRQNRRFFCLDNVLYAVLAYSVFRVQFWLLHLFTVYLLFDSLLADNIVLCFYFNCQPLVSAEVMHNSTLGTIDQLLKETWTVYSLKRQLRRIINVSRLMFSSTQRSRVETETRAARCCLDDSFLSCNGQILQCFPNEQWVCTKTQGEWQLERNRLMSSAFGCSEMQDNTACHSVRKSCNSSFFLLKISNIFNVKTINKVVDLGLPYIKQFCFICFF